MIALLLQVAPVAANDEFVNELVRRFNEGGPYMWPILVCFILGLAIAFERVITLNRADIDTRRFLRNVHAALVSGGIPAAEQVCAKARGPVASIFHAGLMRSHEGIDSAEKAVIAAGSIEMGFLERGLVWLSLFISVAPMLGFLGTVVGMVQAFDAIERAGDISPSLVAGGIRVALLTTVLGLIVAITLQFFFNYASAKIDHIVSDMEVASIELIDTLLTYQDQEVASVAPVPRSEITTQSGV